MSSIVATTDTVETFTTEDQILAGLKLSSPVIITVEFTDDVVTLQIGQRDFEWDRKTKELIGAGTFLNA
jgi:hypothetical protein